MHTPQVITSGVDYIFLIVPVVLVLFGWIGACFWADAHPEVRHVGRAAGPAIPGETGTEATLAPGAADEHQPDEHQPDEHQPDEHQPATGERIAAAEARPERSAEPGQS
jgi:hypothetical protein